MTVALPGLAAPGVGFEVPLEMLSACHGRLQAQCETLQRLERHLDTHGADRAAAEAARAVMRYFDTAAQLHHEDEEQDLFPALLAAMAGSDTVCLREMTEALCADHRRLQACWRRLRPALQAVAERSRHSLADADVPAFIADHRAHLEREESELLPMAARLIDAVTLDRIGLAMRARRGLDTGAVL